VGDVRSSTWSSEATFTTSGASATVGLAREVLAEAAATRGLSVRSMARAVTITSMATEWSPGVIDSGTVTSTSTSSASPGASGAHGTEEAGASAVSPTTRTEKDSAWLPSLWTRTVHGTVAPGRAVTDGVSVSTRKPADDAAPGARPRPPLGEVGSG
jgi:hypothetical protein